MIVPTYRYGNLALRKPAQTKFSIKMTLIKPIGGLKTKHRQQPVVLVCGSIWASVTQWGLSIATMMVSKITSITAQLMQTHLRPTAITTASAMPATQLMAQMPTSTALSTVLITALLLLTPIKPIQMTTVKATHATPIKLMHLKPWVTFHHGRALSMKFSSANLPTLTTHLFCPPIAAA